VVLLLCQLLSQLQHCVCHGTVLITIGGMYDQPAFLFTDLYYTHGHRQAGKVWQLEIGHRKVRKYIGPAKLSL